MIRFIFLLSLLLISASHSVQAQYYGSQGPNPPIPVSAPTYMGVDAKINIVWPREGDLISNIQQQLPQSMIVRYDVSGVPAGGNYLYEQYHPYNRICIFPVVDGKIHGVKMYGGFVGTYFAHFPSWGNGGEYPYNNCYGRSRATEAQSVTLPLPQLPDGDHTYGAIVYVGLNPGETPYYSNDAFLRNCSSCIGVFYANTQFYLATYTSLSAMVTARTGPPPPSVTLYPRPSAVTLGGSSVLGHSTNNVQNCYTSGDWSGYTIPKSSYRSGTWNTGPLTEPASYTLACVSPEGLWATSTATVGIINSNYPDLTALTPSISSSRTGTNGGQFLSFALTIKNIGKIVSRWIPYNAFRIDRNNDGTWSALNFSSPGPAGFGGEEKHFLTEGMSQFEPGTHSVMLCADSVQRNNTDIDNSFVLEYDETNNCSEKLVFTVTATPEPVRIDGVCGALNGISTTTLPLDRRGGMCLTGASSTVSNLAGPWNWTCSGSSGGTSASCSAQTTSLLPDLVSTNLSISSANPRTDVPLTLGARVRNQGGVDAGIFSDNFSYRWGAGSFIDLNPFISQSGLSTGANVRDTYTFTPDRGGDLYIQHCVDSNNQINEGVNETPNCSVVGPYMVTGPVGSCPVQTIAFCSLSQTPPSTNANGTCTTGYVGSCRYACDATGNWDQVSEFANSCTALTGEINAPSPIPWGSTTTVTWTSNGNQCRVEGDPGGVWENLGNNGSRLSSPLTTDTDYTLSCGNILLDSTQIKINTFVDLQASPRIVNRKDTQVTLTWSTPGVDDDLCTLTGFGIQGSPLKDNGTGTNGGSTVVQGISGRIEYVLTCPDGSDRAFVEFQGVNQEH